MNATTHDFARSYIRFRVDLAAQSAITLSHKPPTTVNNVRIGIECRCELIHRPTGVRRVYALGASCKTERVGAARDLWLEPNADFCLVLSAEEFLIIKNWQKCNMGVMRFPPTLGVQPERQIGDPREAWVDCAVSFREVPAAAELGDFAAIIDAIRSERPLVSRTEYDDGDYRVSIDHPVKTINYSEREGVYQTDTGPVLLPDLSPARLTAEPALIGCLDLAYSAFNAREWAEFIVQAPTAVSADTAVNHYSRARRIEHTRNVLLALP
jgi:hypothetical protein